MRDKPPRIGLDSNCFSYLLDALNGIDEPKEGHLKNEYIALVRIFFYDHFGLWLTKAVLEEAQNINEPTRREMHRSWSSTLFGESDIQNPDHVQKRINELQPFHGKSPKDCRVIAEAEDIFISVLLTYDKEMIKRLADKTNNLKLMMPSDYWLSLNIPHGQRPKSRPHETNPLYTKTWWHW